MVGVIRVLECEGEEELMGCECSGQAGPVHSKASRHVPVCCWVGTALTAGGAVGLAWGFASSSPLVGRGMGQKAMAEKEGYVCICIACTPIHLYL